MSNIESFSLPNPTVIVPTFICTCWWFWWALSLYLARENRWTLCVGCTHTILRFCHDCWTVFTSTQSPISFTQQSFLRTTGLQRLDSPLFSARLHLKTRSRETFPNFFFLSSNRRLVIKRKWDNWPNCVRIHIRKKKLYAIWRCNLGANVPQGLFSA